MMLDTLGRIKSCDFDAVQSSQVETCFDLETSRQSYGQGFKIFLGLYVFLGQVGAAISVPFAGVASWGAMLGQVILAALLVPFVIGFGAVYFPSFFRKIRLVVVPERRVLLLESVSLRGDKLVSVKVFPIDEIASIDYQDRSCNYDEAGTRIIEKCRISLRFYDGHRVTIADTEDVHHAMQFYHPCHSAIFQAKGN